MTKTSSLTDQIRDYLRQRAGTWVEYTELRSAFEDQLPWEREVIVADDEDGMHDYAQGSAWLGQRTGQRDYRTFVDALHAVTREGNVEEGYPGGGPRSFKLKI